MPGQIGLAACIAAEHAKHGRVRQARNCYHATFGRSTHKSTVIHTFQNTFACAAAEAAARDSPGFIPLFKTACRLWGHETAWEKFVGALGQQALRAYTVRDDEQVHRLRSAMVEARPPDVRRESAYHIFWKATGIKVRHLRRPLALARMLSVTSG